MHESRVSLGGHDGRVRHVLTLGEPQVDALRRELAVGVEHGAERALQPHVLLGQHDLLVGDDAEPQRPRLLLGDGVVQPDDEHPDEGRVELQLHVDRLVPPVQFVPGEGGRKEGRKW